MVALLAASEGGGRGLAEPHSASSMVSTLARPEEARSGERAAARVPAWPGPTGVALRLFVFGLSFGLATFLLQRIASPGGGSLIGAKQEHWAAAAKRYDTVFLGTSHVYRAFVPEAFDEALATAGLESRAFNFGIQLPNQLELAYLFERVLEEGEGRLARIFVQYHELVPQLDPAQEFIPRNVYWHDWDETAKAIERTFALSASEGLTLASGTGGEHSLVTLFVSSLPATWRVALSHIQHFVVRALVIGRGKDVARGLLGRTHGLTPQMAARRGYVPLEDDEAMLARDGNPNNTYTRRREDFLARHADYRAGVERLATEARVVGDEEWRNAELASFGDLSAYAEMASLARAAGIEFVLVVMPANSCDRALEARMAEEIGAPVLIYNDPRRYPRFYDPVLRFDSGHFTREGALEFTRALAADIVRLEEGP